MYVRGSGKYMDGQNLGYYQFNRPLTFIRPIRSFDCAQFGLKSASAVPFGPAF